VADEDDMLRRPSRVAHVDAQHEAIELRFGQREGSLEFARVLRRQHDEVLRRTAKNEPAAPPPPPPPPPPTLRPTSSTTCTPMISLGLRSAVPWMRLNSPPNARASALANSVLPSPGTP